MKVLFVNQVPEVNNKYTFSLARALIRNGIDVTVCGIEKDDVSNYKDVPFAGIFGSYSNESGYIKKVLSYKNSWDRVVEYCELNEIDIVHVQWYIFSPMDWHYHKILRNKNIKVVTTIHDLLPFNRKIYDFFFHKKIYSNSDMVISQARMNESVLIDKFCVREEKIRYIPHGHYMEYAEVVSKEDSLQYLNLPKGKKIVLFFGQIKKVKGVDVLINAMKMVSEKHEDAYCIIAGKVWKDDFSLYSKQILELQLEEYIRTDIRYISDKEIKYYFNAADVVALPYLQIYQSGVVLLGVAYKKPIVATTEGEFKSLFRNHETGILVQAGSAKELADAIIWYFDNYDEGQQYAEKAYEDINIRLSWDTISKDIENVYYAVMRS